jgi:hypothetical protein
MMQMLTRLCDMPVPVLMKRGGTEAALRQALRQR